MRINTNVMALNAQNKLTSNQGSVEKSIQKLSSGLRINGAADDAAGLAISEKMRAQIRGLGQAQSNAQDGISLLQTAEGALQQTTDILQRMRELVIKAQNTGVLTSDDRTSIDTELTTLKHEIDRIADSTTFNGKQLLNGDMGTQVDTVVSNSTILADTTKVIRVNAENSEAGKYELRVLKDAGDTNVIGVKLVKFEADGSTVDDSQDLNLGTKITSSKLEFDKFNISIEFDLGDTGSVDINTTNVGGQIVTLDSVLADNGSKKTRADFKIGANSDNGDLLSMGIGDMTATGLSKTGDAEFTTLIDTAENANATLENIDYAISRVSAQRAKLGTMQNRMEYATSSLSTTEENLTAAESRIRDVDMAEEMVSYTKNSILNQSAMAMLAQANQQPQQILSLLQ